VFFFLDLLQSELLCSAFESNPRAAIDFVAGLSAFLGITAS